MVPDTADERGIPIEEAARIERYRFLFDQAEKFNCQAVAVGHNADDQVETVLMHLLRGAGVDGVKGMRFRLLPNPWSERIPLVRPLLATWRSEIEAYCRKRDLDTITDPTNQDTSYFRNRLRHEFIPQLESFVPGVQKRIWRTSDLIRADLEILEDIAIKKWSKVVAHLDPDAVFFDLPEFNSQPLGLKRRLVRMAIGYLKHSVSDIEFNIIQSVLGFAEEPTQTRQMDIGLGLRVLYEKDFLIFTGWDIKLTTENWPQIEFEMHLEIPGILEFQNGWYLKVEEVENFRDVKRAALDNSDPFQAWMQCERDITHIVVRGREPGDVFKPLGMDGRKMKLSDFMINVKIPQRTRANWPLICVEDEIAWVPGYRLAHPFRLAEALTEDRKYKVIKLGVQPPWQ
jgi:tRNA(Ile)-lysidine synthase